MDKIETGLRKIKSLFGKRALHSLEDLMVYSYDATKMKGAPHMVVYPENEEEVRELVKIASEYEIPLIPRGAGSGFAGGVVPTDEGGVILSAESMRRIKDIDERNMIAIVEPGVITGDFHKTVESMNLFYPPDPASLEFSTIGGNVSTNAGGLRAVKYGVTRDYVLSLRVVLANSSVIRTRAMTVKDVAGYDITGLFVGAEGTLGFVSEVTVKLLPKPERKGTLLAFFRTSIDAINAGIEVIRNGVLPATMEFMDKTVIDLVRFGSTLSVPEGISAALLLEDDGFEESVLRSLKVMKEVCLKNGAIEAEGTIEKEKANEMWKIRRAISPALAKLAPFRFNQDVVVLRTKIPELLKKAEAIANLKNLKIANFGHLGDGNIHVNFLYRTKEEEKRAKEAVGELLKVVVELKGSITGEHGVGRAKLQFIKEFMPKELIELMKGIKKIFDPKNIFNPGKLIPYD
jgi:glycolate oxidase subunit GlcD